MILVELGEVEMALVTLLKNVPVEVKIIINIENNQSKFKLIDNKFEFVVSMIENDIFYPGGANSGSCASGFGVCCVCEYIFLTALYLKSNN